MEETFQRIMKETRKALRENEHIVRALVALLMEKEELLADEVKAFFDQYGLYHARADDDQGRRGNQHYEAAPAGRRSRHRRLNVSPLI